MPSDRPTLLRSAEVLARTGVSKSALYAMSAVGSFPKPVKLGSTRALGWVEIEVEAWIREQIERRHT